MDSPLVELVQQIGRLDWYEAGAFSDVRDLERMTARNASPPELLRTLRADRDRLQDILPSAHRLIGHAADFATLVGGTPAGAALNGRVAVFERLTAPDGPLDQLRRRIAAWTDDTFRHLLRQWGEPEYDLDECLWPVFGDTCGRVTVAPPDCQFEFLILRKLFGSLDILRLNFVEAVRWLTLCRSIPGSPRLAPEEDREELLKLNAQAEGDAQHGCWLIARCQAACRVEGNARRLAAGLCRWPAIQQRSILAAAQNLAPLGRQTGSGLVTEGVSRSPRVSPCRRGRTPDPAIQSRNRRIEQVWQEKPTASLKEVAKLLRLELGADLTDDVVRNVKKGLLARRRTGDSSEQ